MQGSTMQIGSRREVGRSAIPLADAFATELERELRGALRLQDEERIDPLWRRAQAMVREFTMRPAKRIRPWLVAAGHALGGGAHPTPRGVWRFGAAVELLHTFMLVHDDVADVSELRRGGPTLHRSLAALGPGNDLAIVAGDHLFANAIDRMLGSGLPGAAKATRAYLKVCRHTAAGQFLDLALSRKPLAELTPFHALKVAHLKTARYSFAAPLACGVILAGADGALVSEVERIGCLAGLAFQLRDDLIGTFGDPAQTGKPADDLSERKRTFPLLVAWRRADHAERMVLEDLGPGVPSDRVAHAREIIELRGGRAATERVMARAMAAARRQLRSLEAPATAVAIVGAMLEQLADRAA